MTTEIHLPLLLAAMGLVAALYASVGHGGASGYLAIMAMAAFPAAAMRPTALVLNIAVSLLAGVAFFRFGHFRGSLFWPFAASSIPFAYLGGSLRVHSAVFQILLALALTFAALRLVLPAPNRPPRPAPAWLVVLMGAALGLVSGLIGIGGGIFLTPLVILCGWADAKTASGISAPFILVNSLAGLAGLGADGLSHLAPAWPAMLAAVLAGGAIGSLWGSGAAHPRAVKAALSLVLALATVKLIATL